MSWPIGRQFSDPTYKKQRQEHQAKKAETLQRLTQKKITEKWNRLLAHEKRHLEQEETRRRRLELRYAKLNIWKR